MYNKVIIIIIFTFSSIINYMVLNIVLDNRSLLVIYFIYSACLVTSVMSNSLWPHGPWPTRLLRPWDSPGKNTGVGCHFLLQWWLWNSDIPIPWIWLISACLGLECLLVTFPYFLQSVYSFLCVVIDISIPLSVVRQWPDKTFLKYLAPKWKR